jgi:4-amino-4-deoxy-L-arabinose transferase-like glycosyltransferase
MSTLSEKMGRGAGNKEMFEREGQPIEVDRSKSLSVERLDYRALRAIVLLAVLLLGAYVAFFRLGVNDWHPDELVYRDAGLEYVRDNDFSSNQEHPFLVKYILGITQDVLGSSEAEAVRIPAATAALLTGFVLFAFVRRVAGYWTGVLALALWVVSPLTLAFGRLAILEVFLAFFSTLALYLGWRWAETTSWGFAALAGVAIGLATTSKLVGILFLPAILFAGLLKIGISRLLILQSILIGLAAAVTALATYAPIWGRAFQAIRYMLDRQSAHNAGGHWVEVNGIPYAFPPWWTHLWWQWEFYGMLATLSLGVVVVIALLQRRPLELYLLAATLVPFLFLSFCVRVKIYHYIYDWQPPLILLLALTAGKLARRGVPGVIFATLLLVPFGYLGVETVKAVSHVQPGAYAAVAEYLEDTGQDRGPILVWGHVGVAKAYLPDVRIARSRGIQTNRIKVVIVDSSVSRRSPDPLVESYLETNRNEFKLAYTAVDKDDKVELDNFEGDIEVYTRKFGG